MPISSKFTGEVREELIPTYDFFDISEGTGIQNYYAAIGYTGAATTYFLTRDTTINSNTPHTSRTASGDIINQDFDVVFNLPKVIDGKLVANVPIGRDSSGAEEIITTTVQVIHFDGSTETVLVSGSETVTAPNGATLPVASRYRTLVLDVPRKNFKATEILRINLQVAKANGSGVGYVGHDPANRTIPSDLSNTRCIFLVPFVIDL